MSASCTTRAYNGCACLAGQCRIETRRKEDEAKLRRILAKRNADTALMMFGATLSMAAVIASFVFVAIPESQRLSRANQEQVSWT